MTSRALILAGIILLGAQTPAAGHQRFEWRNLPDLPQALGGQFVGVVHGHLVVAGGSYFTKPPWDGGKKQWVDTIYTLGRHDQQWRLSGHLPSPLGYGASITTLLGMLCIGGETPAGNSKQVLRLQWRGNRIVIHRLADLPETTANLAGALAGDTVYVAGGQANPKSTQALHTFWSLSLAKPDARWQTLPAWPGPPRILPAMAVAGSSIYLIGGADLTGTPGPPAGRKYLADAYRYSPRQGWHKIADVPQPSVAGVAAPTDNKLLVFGGDDGSLYMKQFEIKDRHPGYSRAIYEFDPTTGRWSTAGHMPASLVTTGLAVWNQQFVIAGGEDRPGHRSPRVLAGQFSTGGR